MKYALTLVGFAVLAVTGAIAQTVPQPLVDAARKTVVSSPDVQARWRAFNIADADRSEARAGYFPQIDGRVGVGRERNVRPVAGSTGWYGYRTSALTLNQMLFDGFFTRSEVARLGHAKLTRYYELLDASETAALDTVKAYADVVRYRELVAQSKLNYGEHRRTTALIEERVAGGVGRRVDLEQAVGRLALAETNLSTDLANLYDVTARYQRIVGELPPEDLPTFDERLRLGGLPAGFEDTIRQGMDASPALSAAVENVRAAEAGIAARKAAYLPRLDFQASQTWYHNLLGERGPSRDSQVGLVLSYNFYRGGADDARKTKAVETHSQALDLQEKVCRDVRQNIVSAFNDAQRLQEQMGFLAQHQLSTEKSREAYRQQYDIGQRTLLDLLDTQNEYFQASRAYINGRFDRVLAQGRALAAMGQLMASLGVSRPDMPSASDAGQEGDGAPPRSSDMCQQAMPAVVTLEQARATVDVTPRPRANTLPPGEPAPRKP
ncbi:TolC family outer membrane protein [Paenacidovorax monticola]|uniref:TolC family outer membrane protein n=1 Tax=Paenacidovorax monticola TaxID=1926868 RepID=A0A7H0HBB9_9BURK|nr:TolC family outer membrane protein [Paenacidovorax monticola]QNP57835.1 TolC family outer membrane protein [Paenacidovorax monticola]